MLPDGCIDILTVSCAATGEERLRVTNWDLSPRQVDLRAGMTVTGFRLRPGTIVHPDFNDVVQELAQDVTQDVSRLASDIESYLSQDQEITEIIEALSAPDSSVKSLARQQGVSERTLQRHFKATSRPPPGFWRQLGRARQAVQALQSGAALAAIAADYGYSDQAHMTREFMRWFAQTPRQLRQNPEALLDLAQPGLGNWSN